MDDFRDRGVRALVLLHEREMRRFLETWRRASAAGIRPPACDDPAYASLERLLVHVLRAACGYLVWTCEVVGLGDAEVRQAPEPEAVAAEADAFLEHVLERWRAKLPAIEAGAPDRIEAPSRWRVSYSVDAMLEHAVMHPVRHAFQIEEWLSRREA